MLKFKINTKKGSFMVKIKLKSKYFLIISFISILSQYKIFIKARTLSDKINQINYNNQDSSQDIDLFRKFLVPIHANHSSIKKFLVNTFNSSYYGEFLALDFSHITSLLSFYDQTQEPKRYIRSILRLFSQKIKSCSYINSYAFLKFLDQLSLILYPIFIDNTQSNVKQKYNHLHIKSQIKECLYNYFLNNFQNFKKDPSQELEKLSVKLSSIATENLNKDNNQDKDISNLELQHNIIRFLELVLNKLIWSPKDQTESWENLKSIAQRLEKLMINNIIPDIETLNENYWSLIQRYCYFLELFAILLKIETIESIAREVKDKNLPLWTLEEQESLTINKKACLKSVLLTAHASNKLAN